MTSVNESLDSESTSYRRPYTVHRQESLSELSRMNNLNTRFMSFLDTVKSETKRSQILSNTILEQKKEIFTNLTETNLNYYEELMSTKKYLNEVTLDLNNYQINERSNRIRIEWFSNLLKFELNNLNQRPNYNLALANSLNFHAQVNSELNKVTIPSVLVSQGSSTDQLNLSISTSSNMTSSQTSLSSMSCSSSSANVSEGLIEDINVIQVLLYIYIFQFNNISNNKLRFFLNSKIRSRHSRPVVT